MQGTTRVMLLVILFTASVIGYATSQERGAVTYENDVTPIIQKKCASCHGDKGDGKGPLSKGLNPKPTNFKESHGKKMTDGEHFWKITTGRGPMPSYGKDLTEEERWHVINYINKLH